MKTALLTKYHEKCLNILEAIKQAESRQNTAMEYVVKRQMTTPRNELKLWPCGAPDMEGLEERFKTAQAVLIRLEKYYLATIKKIQLHATESAPVTISKDIS